MYVRKYLEESDTKVLMYYLLDNDYKYRGDIQSKAEFKKIPLLHEFFLIEDHYNETPYSLKFRVCGKNRCKFFARLCRTLWNTSMVYGALQNKFL